MRILAFDMALTTGWAEGVEGGSFTSGTWRYYDGKKPMCMEDRWLNFQTDLIRKIAFEGTFPVNNAVVYERAHFRGGDATRSAVGFETVLRIACWQWDIPTFPVHSGSLKLHITGYGKAPKADMISYAENALGRKVIDDNEADAICLLAWGKESLYVGDSGEVQLVSRTPKKARRGKPKPKENQ